jgi:hypothetical protein
MYQPDRLAHLTQTNPVDPFSLDALIAWLRTKPGDGEYCYLSTGRCLVAQYYKYIGADYPVFDPCYPSQGAFDVADFGSQAERIALTFPHTFAAALQRALAYREGRT